MHTKRKITLCISRQYTACELINNGFAAIFGPQDKITASQSMCDTLDIPHIAVRWDSKPKQWQCNKPISAPRFTFHGIYFYL